MPTAPELCFRHRSALLTIVGGAVGAAAFQAAPLDAAAVAAGLTLTLAGTALRVWAMRVMGKSARVHHAGARALRAAGPYARLRNPLYVANAAITAGLGALAAGAAGALVALPCVALVYALAVHHEERCLAADLGDAYREYLGRVPRWWPRLGRVADDPVEPVPWREVARRELPLVVGVPAALAAVLLVRTEVVPLLALAKRGAALVGGPPAPALVLAATALAALGNAAATEAKLRRRARINAACLPARARGAVSGAALVVTGLLAVPGRSAAHDAAAPPLDSPLRLRLLAPLSQPRNTQLYSGFGIPLLRGGRGAEEGVLTARLRSSQTHFADTGSDAGHLSRMDAVYIEHARVELTLAVHDRVALWTELRFAGWDERRDVFRVRDETGALVIQGEARKERDGVSTSRHENLAVLAFGAQVTLLRGDDGVSALGASIALKVPGFRRGDITSSGTTDVALTLHGSLGLLERVALHADAGVVVPLGQPWVFQDADAFRVDELLQAALGVTWAVTDWLALGASVEGETSPWGEELEFLDRPALTLAVGARARLGRLFVEAGVGAGLDDGSADWLAWVELGWVSGPLWR